jgi:peptidyl-prolyl cis-trans isomerase C
MNSSLPRLLLATALGVALSGFSAAALAQAAGAGAGNAAKVNGVAIPKSRVDLFVKAQGAQGAPDSPQLREAVVRELVMRELISQEATKRGLQKDPEVASQLELTRQSVLVAAYRQNFIKKNPISDAALKAEYEKAKTEAGDKEFKARHILVDSEAQAQEIITKLRAGEKFEELAKASKDEGSKNRGGELDWAPPATYVKPFAEALSKLEKGKFTETPVQTRNGYHVIMLDDVRPSQFPAFDEVKGRVAQAMQAQAFEKNIRELHNKAKIEQ